MYYFLSHTDHLIGNDPVMTKKFSSTLQGPVFTCFMQLPAETIKALYNVKRGFLSHFFKDDTEILVHSFLATKQKEDEMVKSFIEHILMWCPHSMSQETLIETVDTIFKPKYLLKWKLWNQGITKSWSNKGRWQKT